MSWVKLDDGFPTHRKTRKAGVDGVALYTCALCYCARHLTDGVIPKDDLESVWPWGGVDLDAVAQKLVSCGLFIDDGAAYVINDFLAYNPSKAKVIEEREKGKARAAASYAKREAKRLDDDSSGEEQTKKERREPEENAKNGRRTPEERPKNSEEASEEHSAEPFSSPDPSRPVPSLREEKKSAGAPPLLRVASDLASENHQAAGNREPARLMTALADAIAMEFERRKKPRPSVHNSQRLQACVRVQDALDLKSFDNAIEAIEALVKAAADVAEKDPKKKFGFELGDVPFTKPRVEDEPQWLKDRRLIPINF